MLGSMVAMEGGGRVVVSSKFEPTKLTIIGFSRRWVVNPGWQGKTVMEMRPDFQYAGISIKPSTLHKFWGS